MRTLRHKIAFLNVVRNYRRSAITLAAIVFGCISLVIFGGFVRSMYDGMRENVIRSELGHIQIYRQGYNQYGTVDPQQYLMPQKMVERTSSILKQREHVRAVAPRLNFSGLLSNGKQTLAVQGAGVDFDSEALLSSAVKVVKGRSLFPEDRRGALLGKGLFRGLNAEVGDYVTLLANTAKGALNAFDVKIVGVADTGNRIRNERFIRINLADAQELLRDKALTRLVVLLDDTERTDRVNRDLNRIFKRSEIDLETRTWDQLADYYHEVVALFDGVFGFIKVIVFLIVALSISNTMMMAVMERTREIGTIRAMGGTPGEVTGLITLEAVYLGLIGSTIGIVVGIAGAHLITEAQWLMPTPPGSSEQYPIRIFVVPDVLLETWVLGNVMSLLGSLYPSIKASRIPVVSALRHA